MLAERGGGPGDPRDGTDPFVHRKRGAEVRFRGVGLTQCGQQCADVVVDRAMEDDTTADDDVRSGERQHRRRRTCRRLMQAEAREGFAEHREDPKRVRTRV